MKTNAGKQEKTKNIHPAPPNPMPGLSLTVSGRRGMGWGGGGGVNHVRVYVHIGYRILDNSIYTYIDIDMKNKHIYHKNSH